MYSVKNLSHNKNLDGNLVDNFLDFVTKELGLDQPFSVYFIDDKKNAKDALGKTAMYNPGTKSVYVYATNRHPKDILRSVAHELMHHKQHCDGHLQNMSLEDAEMQANEAGYLLRKYEDGLKQDKLKEQEDQQPARLPGEISITTQDDPEIAFRNVWIEKWEEGKLPFIKNEKQLENFLIKAWNTHQGMMRKREMASASKRMAYAQILDLVGVIPVAGEVADIISAQIKYDYATRKEADEGLDAAAIYYIDAAISLLAATVVGEGLKLLSVVVKTLGKYGARFSLFVLSKIYKVPPEVVVARIKDGLEIIKKKIGAKFSKVSESADRIGSQLDESLEMITLLRTAEAQLAKFTIENLSKMSTKEIYGMLLRNKVTQKKFTRLVNRSFSPQMAEIIAQRRLKYFYDMPNTKELLNSKEFAEDVLEKLNLPLEEITKLLSNVTEKEADDVFALLDFMMNTRQAGVVGASSTNLLGRFGTNMLEIKTGKELAEYARSEYLKEFSNIFQQMVGYKQRAEALFVDVLDEVGFKELFIDLAEKRSKELAKKIADLKSGKVNLDTKTISEIKVLAIESKPANIVKRVLTDPKIHGQMRDAALDFTTSYAKRGSISKQIDKILFTFFPKTKQIGGALSSVAKSLVGKNILGRRYLTDGFPANYGGVLVGKTAAKLLGLIPILGNRVTTRSARFAIESLVGMSIASAITANRFYKFLYPPIPGGGGKGGDPSGKGRGISKGQQEQGEEARKGIESGFRYPVKYAKYTPDKSEDIKEEAEELKKELEKAKLPPEVEELASQALKEIIKKPTPENVNKQIEKAAKKTRNNLRKIKDDIKDNPKAPAGMPDTKGEADPQAGGEGGGQKGRSGTGTGPGSGEGEAEGETYTYSQFMRKYKAGKQKRGFGDDTDAIIDGIEDLVKKYKTKGAIKSARTRTERESQVVEGGLFPGGEGEKTASEILDFIKRSKEEKKYAFQESKDASLNDVLREYKEKELNDKFNKLVKGMAK